MDTLRESLERTAQALSTSIGSVFDDLESIAAAVSAVAQRREEAPPRSSFQFLRQDFSRFIQRHADLIVGAGIAYAPDSLPGARHWLEWWRADDTGRPDQARFVTHDLNPDSLDYYDYTRREWFTAPRGTGTPIAVGPYVDRGGINTSIITLSVPAPSPQGVHVLGCDLTLANLEGIFLRALRLRDPAVALMGPSGRVIASNDVRFVSGTLLRDPDIRRAPETLDLRGSDANRLPWKLIALPS